jgi:multidrug efflux pump
MISTPFITRPIATSLLMAGVLLIGAVAWLCLPLAPLPQVDFPTINVSADLPGASAETMATTVAEPLERAFTGISSITQMTSSSSLGHTSVTVQFDLSRNIDAAAADIQAAINGAGGQLPKNLPNPPTYEKVNPADFTMLSLAVTSDTVPLTTLDHYADDFLAQQIAQITGVGLVDFHGEQKPALRVRVDPDALAQHDLTLEDVRAAISTATVNAPKGSLDGPERGLVLDATDQVADAAAWRDQVVAYRDGAPLRLGDIAQVDEAAEDIHEAAWLQNRRAIIIDIHKQPGFNVVQTIQRVKDRLPTLLEALPPGIAVRVVGDRTQTIRSSVDHVQATMATAVLLVVLVVWAFLRTARATVIPAVAIPLSFAATAAVMWLLGYSIDNLSLMGLTIAVGFVVDDAIVVLENISRHIESGKTPIEAAKIGAREVTFTVISMTLSLVAVFVPVLFMGGVIGRMFREFAVTVAVAVVMSGLVSLTVTPMMCARFLHHDATAKPGMISRAFDAAFRGMASVYAWGLGICLRFQITTLIVTAATLAATVWLYVAAPKGFIPQEDTGLIIGTAESLPDSSYAAMSKHITDLGRIVMTDPAVDNVYCWIGANPTLSQGRMLINLKPVDDRDANAAQVIARLKPRIAAVEGAALYMQVRQDIQVGGRPSKTQYQYTLQDGDAGELTHWAPILVDTLQHVAAIQDVTADLQALAPRATLRIDRDSAARFGVTAQDVDNVLSDAFGQRQVATIFTQLDQERVVLEVDPRAQTDLDDLRKLYVRSLLTGRLVPLGLVTTIDRSLAPVTINHQGTFPAITLSFNLAPGKSLGDAVAAIQVAERAVGKPDSLHATFQGTAQAFQDSMRSQPWLILTAVIAVYIVLGVLYESYLHPLTILSSLPSAGVGALLAMRAWNLDLSIIGMISILLLIGIVKKNAIMMIDVALVGERESGYTPTEAVRHAALLRFRPIMMTTMAALFGALPLAIESGAGAELRRPLGIAIVGGLLASQILTLFTTPVVYIHLAHLGRWITGWKK